MSESMEVKVNRLEGYLLENYEFRFNLVLNEVEFKRRNKSEEFVQLEERDLSELRISLSKQGYTGIKSLLDDLLKSRSLAKDYNPFNEYFDKLPKWTSDQPDYVGQLCEFIDVKEDPQWFRRMFEKHLQRTVACVLRLIEFNKHCFVLLGKQNDGKSYLIRYLIPKQLEKYYKENPPLDHKDSIIALSQNLIINLDELADLNKSDANKIKSLFSQSDTKVRAHYGVKDTLQKRYASFFGTTNDKEFLNDVTGNVRWLIFNVESIFHDNGSERGYNRICIDSVWSQVYYSVQNGEKGNLKSDEIKTLESNNRDFQKQTPEMEMISELFEPCDRNMANALPLSTTEILMALQFYTDNSVKFNSVQLGKALTYLGFVKESVRDKYSKYPNKKYFVKSTNPKILDFFAKNLTTLTTIAQVFEN